MELTAGRRVLLPQRRAARYRSLFFFGHPLYFCLIKKKKKRQKNASSLSFPCNSPPRGKLFRRLLTSKAAAANQLALWGCQRLPHEAAAATDYVRLQ